MTLINKLYEFNVPIKDLLQIYYLYIRSILEQSCVVWASALTQGEIRQIERVQKVALKNILKEKYHSYEKALQLTNITTLQERRNKLMLSFAKKCSENVETKHMFPKNEKITNTRISEKYKIPHCNTERLRKSAIPSMARILNENDW